MGCSCCLSTSGGIKSIRGVMLVKVIKNEFRQILHPNAVLPMKVDGYNVQMCKRVTLLAFIGLYLFLAVICAFTMIAAGIDSTNSMTITLSSLGNVGPTLGLEIGPTMSWNELPDFAKWISSFLCIGAIHSIVLERELKPNWHIKQLFCRCVLTQIGH